MNRDGKNHVALLIAVFLLTIFLPVSPTTAQHTPERPLEKLIIAYSSVSANMAPLWITHERGFFRKYGLDVQLVFIESGSMTVQSLISKEVAFAQMAGAGVLQSRLRGSDVVLIAGFLNTMDYQLMVDKGITRPNQLKGKTIAVSRFGSSSDFATRYALDKFGLVPDRDVTILEIGSQPARFAALEAGKIQAAMVAIPLTHRARTLGFHALADLQMLGLEYQHTGLATTEALIRARPDLVRNVMKAYVEGIHYYKTRRAGSLGILAKYLKTPNVEVLTEVHENLGLKLTPQKPYPTLRGIEIMLRELAGRDPKARAAKPDEFVNLAFIKELDNSGFIDRLYKTQPVVAKREERPAPVVPIPQETAVQNNLKARPAREEAKSVSVPAAKPGQYTVETGDTLSYLALKYYGDQYKWEKIYEANKQTMRNPHSLYVGQKIMIPFLDGKLFGEQSLPVFNQLPDYNLERPSATATNISDVSELC
jgi:ABC-type nitrate/sulfonate/bicarbonate transport system substrate-binding protein